MKTLFTWRRTLLGLAAAGVIGQCSAFSFGGGRCRLIPPPTLDETTQAHSETAVFAGGCFWGVQGVFQHVKGVKNAVSGYAGGAANTAQYERVSDGDTGHAESVEVTFDPTQVSYGTLLQIYFSVAHNPTELNRQGPDTGTQYRSAIFPKTPSSRRSPRPTSPSSTPPIRSTNRSSPSWKATTVSTRRRTTSGLPDRAPDAIRTS